MPSFARSFAVDALAKWDGENPGNAVRALFERWCLPGQQLTDSASLRLGLRDGYLNFYIKGQSVAKLGWGRSGPKLWVHQAYVAGRRRDSSDDSAPNTQRYQEYDSAALADPATCALINGWIDTADSYASAEKCFVDELVADNAGVIDLEMGLPASDLPGSERVAPRMDLVVVQLDGSRSPSICFWEAKCANNPELRASEANTPKVFDQLEKYVRWMKEGERLAHVRGAYRRTAAILLDLNDLFCNSEIDPESVDLWRALTQEDLTIVNMQPGLVIGNYWPEGYKASIASSRMAQSAASFARNGHRDKLQRAGIRVHEVGPDHGGPKLPFLAELEQLA